MMVRITDTCAVGPPPDIEQAWALLDIYTVSTPLVVKLLGLVMHYTGRAVESTESVNE